MAEKLSDGADLFREEMETLQSIYMDDDSFKIINEHSFTYKFSPEGSKDFIVQFEICPDYPDEAPNMHLDLLYNVNIGNELKSAIVGALQSEARQYLGVQMIYSLLEWGIDSLGEVVASCQNEPNESEPKIETAPHLPKEKKEILTKAAKKKLADRTDAKGEYPRGWNWVDVIKHLSKSGSSQDPQ